MFFILAVIAATFILGILLAPKVKTENAKASGLSDFNFPRSKEGDPVGLVWGTVKLKSPNTIWAGDFEAQAIKKKQKTGIFSSKKIIIGYKYLIGLDLCFCFGPNVTYRKMWFGKDLVWTGCLSGCENEITIDLPNLYGGKDKQGGVGGTFTLYCGNFDQSRDAYLAAKVSADISAYRGFAHVVFNKFYWGNSAQIQPVYMEVSRFTNELGLTPGFQYMQNGLDANPIEVLYALHVAGWGALGLDPALIDLANWQEVAMTIYNENNGMSIHLANPTDGAEVVKEIMNQINATYFQDPQTGLIKIKLVREDYVLASLPVLGPSEIESIENLSIVLWNEAKNTVRIKFTNRENQYTDAIAPQIDSANIRYSGRTKAVEMKFPYVFDAALAAELAARELSNLSTPLYKMDLRTNRKSVEIGPGDPFILNWPEYGFTQIVMRARKIGSGRRTDGRITIGAVQDEFATAATVIGIPAPSLHVNDNYPPADIVDYLFFEIPYFLEYQATDLDSRNGYYRLAALAKKPTIASIAYSAFIDDGAPEDDDPEMLDNSPYQATAKLDANLAKFEALIDGLIPILIIKELTSTNALADGTTAAVRLGRGLFILNGEWLSYETFTDNLDGTYDLENVRRAQLDSGWIGGLEDDLIWFLDGQEGFFFSDILPALTNLYLIDITSNSRALKADSPLIAVTPTKRKDRPLPPDYITVGGIRDMARTLDIGTGSDIGWRERNRLLADQIAFENDASQAAEAGTSYRIELWRDGVQRFFADGIVQPYSLIAPSSAAGFAFIKLYAVRDGLLSHTPSEIPVYVNTDPDSLTIDLDPVYIDDETVEFS